MPKTILITGATDGIGRETARVLAADGHTLLLHGRTPAKLAETARELTGDPGGAAVEQYVADLSDLRAASTLADEVATRHDHLDVLINNAGVLKSPNPVAANGMDIRFVVNTLAPYLLTRKLRALMGADGRVVNLSSAAQATVDIQALEGAVKLRPMDAYAQSKLAITMWSRHMAGTLGDDGPAIIAVNPGSLLASKMVKEGFGIAGNDLRVGADILCRAALSDEFANASGKYFDNDSGRFAPPHHDALDPAICESVVRAIEAHVAPFFAPG